MNLMRANHSSNRMQFDVQTLHDSVAGCFGNIGDAFVPGHYALKLIRTDGYISAQRMNKRFKPV